MSGLMPLPACSRKPEALEHGLAGVLFWPSDPTPGAGRSICSALDMSTSAACSRKPEALESGLLAAWPHPLLLSLEHVPTRFLGQCAVWNLTWNAAIVAPVANAAWPTPKTSAWWAAVYQAVGGAILLRASAPLACLVMVRGEAGRRIALARLARLARAARCMGIGTSGVPARVRGDVMVASPGRATW